MQIQRAKLVSVVSVLVALAASALADMPAMKAPRATEPFPLTDVRLLDGPFRDAMLRDQKYLLSLDPDRLLRNFRAQCQICRPDAKPLGGWEAPTGELRGHSLGHYLSALSLMYASTGDQQFKQRADYIVGVLAQCQSNSPAAGFHEGYLSAFPESFIEEVLNSQEATLHQRPSMTSPPRIRTGGTSPGAGTSVPGVSRTFTSVAEQMNFFPNELESKYTEIKYIGRGGIAWVFSARRKSDSLMVAVKIPISFDEMTGKSFLNEIAAWETLRHPNIVKVTAVNILPVPFVEMEYVPDALEAIEKPIPVWKAVHLIRGVADGLKYAHEQGFIHRDIKPHNILLDKDFVPKITDWGMSKVLANEVKKSSIAGFSLSYAAPEQVSPSEFGRTDERTDIYQLGVVFYRAGYRFGPVWR